MVMDAAGNLYGVTTTGGLANCFGNTCGVVFKLTPSSSGHWTETVLHKFTGGSDGYFPNSLIMDSAGNLYGTTPYGGGNGGQCNGGTGCGIVFKLSPRPTGPWPETVLYRFSGTDGAQPDALAFDSLGNLYGTTGQRRGRQRILRFCRAYRLRCSIPVDTHSQWSLDSHDRAHLPRYPL